MTPAKRLFDISLSLVLFVLLLPAMLVVALAILVQDGRPVIYRSERMQSGKVPFTLLKFRTMRADHGDAGVTGADKTDRITRTGRILRRFRLDEMPQLLNVLKGDMSLVGPRPPLRSYVEARPDLYDEVLRSRPGLTGLATLVYRKHEERLLAACGTAEATHRVYLEKCVPAKARLDQIYTRNQSVCFDLVLIAKTIGQLFARS